MGTCFDLVALNWLFNRSSRNREVVLEKDTMQILKLRPGECQRDSVTSGDTVYINVDCIVRVIPGSWDEWGGQIVLVDGSFIHYARTFLIASLKAFKQSSRTLTFHSATNRRSPFVPILFGGKE